MALEDGTVYPGIAFGAPIGSGGDLVANTSQTGYQEVATDPSYAGQVVAMTYPLIGNYGRLVEDDQSERPWLRALIVAHATAAVVGRARQVVHLLRATGVPAIAGVDTRALARHLRETGTQRAFVSAPGETDAEAAVAAARGLVAWEAQDFVDQVSAPAPYDIGTGEGPLVAVVDFGLKTNIVRGLRRRGARVRVLPHTASAAEALSAEVAGIVLSPGPGDPARLDGPVALRGRSSRTDGRSWASASATRSSAARRAPRRAACASATTVPTTRSRTSRAARSRSRPRTTRSRSSARRCPRRAASTSASAT